ncbi:MBL fold metallo-hydrolase [Agilicoccus flavus]|uniref:MBL fold metallo-hydrolase n=1 Tax=Agilicoccus flavus TaxID=2775968 RepID=UPI0021F54561|nr:MBL fold metallo-hydrolase [Agilicoccus flavus]
MGFPAVALATNCYVVGPSHSEECVVVDPGVGVLDPLTRLLAEHSRTPVAVLLTHGHLDHVYSAALVGSRYDAPTYVHPDDRYRLDDPVSDVGPLVAVFEQQLGSRVEWTRPDDIREAHDGEDLALAGLGFRVDHAPGHTEGSVLFSVDGTPDLLGPQTGLARTILTGDVLFAGGIGRTDLPGGDDAAMTASLRDVVLGLADDSLVLPGHGPGSTIANERATNPYLQGLHR